MTVSAADIQDRTGDEGGGDDPVSASMHFADIN